MTDWSEEIRKPEAWKWRLLAFVAYPLLMIFMLISVVVGMTIAWPLMLVAHKLPKGKT